VSDDPRTSAPAFYAVTAAERGRRWSEWWLLLHPPYTLWHLSYVAIGASISSEFDGVRLVATLIAFFLAVGLAAHALDELHDRPLRTSIQSWLLVAVAATSLLGSVALGLAGIARLGPAFAVFIGAGVVLNCGYNLELWGGRLHNDVTFALAWGAFPVLTSYYAQTETIRAPAVLAAVFAFGLSSAQRALSTPARALRRRVAAVEGTITFHDGRTEAISRSVLLKPIETALKATSWSVLALAVALVTFRVVDGA
jgi:hypothetical protein